MDKIQTIIYNLDYLWHIIILYTIFFSYGQTIRALLFLAGLFIWTFEKQIRPKYPENKITRFIEYNYIVIVYYLTGSYLSLLIFPYELAKYGVTFYSICYLIDKTKLVDQSYKLLLISSLVWCLTYFNYNYHVSTVVAVCVGLTEMFLKLQWPYTNLSIILSGSLALHISNFYMFYLKDFFTSFLIPSVFAVAFTAIMLILPIKSYPIDGGYCWGKGRIFGDNKTVNGLLVISLGFGFGYLSLGQNLFSGLLLGLLICLSELPNSFVKRRLGIDNTNNVDTSKLVNNLSDIVDQLDICLGYFIFKYQSLTPEWIIINGSLIYLFHKYEDTLKKCFLKQLGRR